MDVNQTHPKNHGYVSLRIVNPTNLQYEKGTKHTILMIICYFSAVLILITSFVIAGVFVYLTGLNSILFAFYGTSRDSILFWTSFIHDALFTAATAAWIVMIGCFIRSLIKRKRIRGPKILCKQMLHASAVWIIILKVILGSATSALESIRMQETYCNFALVVLLIEFVLNIIFLLCYYWYAVKLDFGLITEKAVVSENHSQSCGVTIEKPPPICVAAPGSEMATNTNTTYSI